MNREYLNLQFKSVPSFGIWSKLSDNDLNQLKSFQDQGWEVYQTVNIRGSFGFTSHVLFLLRKEKS
jgi:hypothetical protein